MPDTVCIGVDEKAALVIVGDRVSCISADGGKSMCYKKYVTNTDDGLLVEIPIIPDSKPIALSELLSVPRRIQGMILFGWREVLQVQEQQENLLIVCKGQ